MPGLGRVELGYWTGDERLREPHRRRGYKARRITERPNRRPAPSSNAPAGRINGAPPVSESFLFLGMDLAMIPSLPYCYWPTACSGCANVIGVRPSAAVRAFLGRRFGFPPGTGDATLRTRSHPPCPLSEPVFTKVLRR